MTGHYAGDRALLPRILESYVRIHLDFVRIRTFLKPRLVTNPYKGCEHRVCLYHHCSVLLDPIFPPASSRSEVIFPDNQNRLYPDRHLPFFLADSKHPPKYHCLRTLYMRISEKSTDPSLAFDVRRRNHSERKGSSA